MRNQTENPTKAWYQGRAGAESAKTLAWRYAVAGDPFPASLSNADAERSFVNRLDEVPDDLDGLNLEHEESGHEITSWMEETRHAPLAERKQIYADDRIEDEVTWYSRKAEWNKRQNERWGGAMLALEAFGLAQGLLRATGVMKHSFVGFIGTAVAVIFAWAQSKDYEMLASAYDVTSRELSAIDSLIEHQKTEEQWANFVANAEDAISREHVLWRASRRT